MLKYDRDILNKWRNKAITKIEDIKIGGVYYSNFDDSPKPFTVVRIMTYGQHYTEGGTSTDMLGDRYNQIGWMEVRYLDFQPRHEYDKADRIWSMNDRNIGASYNPWLVFEKEEDVKNCIAELEVDYVSDTHDDWHDDWHDPT